MSYPMLAPSNTWYTSSIAKSTFKTINIVDSADEATVASATESWAAAVDADGDGALDDDIMCYVNGTTLTIAGNGSGSVHMNPDSTKAFSGDTAATRFTAVTNINGGDVLDTSKVTNPTKMFNNCNSLKTIDVSNWNTSNMTTMHTMFQGCFSLEELDVSNWNTSNVTAMAGMFNSGTSGHNTSLKELDVSNWNTSKVTDMKLMFVNYRALEELDVSKWNTSNVTDMNATFQYCTSLKSLNVSNWNTSNVTKMNAMFQECSALESLNVSNWNTSNVTTMAQMFQGCFSLEELDVSNWNTSSVETMKGMFAGGDIGTNIVQFKELDVSNWDVRNVTDMSFMFYNCRPQTSTVDVSNWSVSKVQNFDHMFAHSYMSNIDTSNWVTSSATNMYGMFHSIRNTTIDVSNFNTSKVKSFGQMFERLSNLTEIKGLENFNTSSGIDFDEMFIGCSKLTKLDLSSFDTRNATFNNIQVSTNGGMALSTWNMFNGMSSLQEIKLGENFTFTGDGTTKSGYSYGVLPTPNITYIANADGNWYTDKRKPYAPADIPNNTAATYYASVDLVNDIDYLVKNGTMLDIADAIRIASGTEDRLSPSAIPESILSIPDVNLDEVYEAGKEAEYDAFWDTYQLNGSRKDYNCSFAGAGWTNETFRPKHDMVPATTYMMFRYSGVSGDLVALCEACGIEIDFSECSNAQYCFSISAFTRVGVFQQPKGVNLRNIFDNSPRLVTVDKFISYEHQVYFNVFDGCTSLANITFEGVIGSSINFQWSPLTKASITNIVEHLSSTATGKTCTFNKSAKEAAFTADEWAALIANKTNWTFSLV